ncbi:hypothetical protein K491DRAFT_570814, partial [Lophiostoma macrostomum CBS 122681]
TMTFTDEYEPLPSTGPPDRPHIIEIAGLKGYDYEDDDGLWRVNHPRQVMIWDVIATVLFKISPGTLEQFLNPEVEYFKLMCGPFDKGGCDFIIWRKNQEVLVGHYVDLVFHKNPARRYDCLEWDYLVRCDVGDDGAWKLKRAAFCHYTPRNMESVW